MKRELTLCILKPSLVKNPIAVNYVQYLLKKENFEILKSKKIALTDQQALQFYNDHSTKFFFNRLVTFICSGPVIASVLARENAIQKWRELMGPTQVFKGIYTHPNTIRSMFGLSDTRNGTHGSDSLESANNEITFFFPEFSINNWYKQDNG